ncbi:MAG: hypothetical protein AB7S41_11720 [Parvibaculaceae bacterium]
MRLPVLALFLLVAATGAKAAESGCDKFKWPLEHDRSLLLAENRQILDSGTILEALPSSALQLALRPPAEVSFEKPPERAAKIDPSFAGVLKFPNLPKAGTYRISIDGEAWIDVIQGGAYVDAADFTGARDCPGLRKSVTFVLEAAPVTLQFSGATAEKLGILVTAP